MGSLRIDDFVNRGDYYAGASFSNDGVYRYALWRRWGIEPLCAFIMLNPSTATESVLDPTVRRCENYAMKWGHGGVLVLNIFARRSTDPDVLYWNKCEPVGPLNDDVIDAYMSDGSLSRVVCAWGVHGAIRDRGHEVATHLIAQGVTLSCLGLTKAGLPKHPLYLRNDVQPQPFAPRSQAT